MIWKKGAGLGFAALLLCVVTLACNGSSDLARGFEEQERRLALAGRAIRTFVGHEEFVVAVTVTPDGKHIVSGDVGGIVRVWELATGRSLPPLRAHDYGIVSVMVSVDGKRLISVGAMGTLKVWDFETGRLIRSMETPDEGKVLTAAKVTSNERYAILGYYDGTIVVWAIGSGTKIESLSLHKDKVDCVSMTADERHVISAGKQTIKVWEIETRRLVHSLEMPPKELVRGIAAIPGKRGIVVGGTFFLNVWDFETGRMVYRLSPEDRVPLVNAVVVARNGEYAVSAHGDNTLGLWRL